MNKDQHIQAFRYYLDSNSSDRIIIPDNRIEDFWTWFSRKSKIAYGKKIKNSLLYTDININSNSCYKNSFRIAKAFKKKLFYFEGFAFRSMDSMYIKHAYNANNFGKVYDYSLHSIDHEDINEFFNCYIGVRIPLNFVKKIYSNRDGINTQYTVLVARFMFENQLENYLDYTSL